MRGENMIAGYNKQIVTVNSTTSADIKIPVIRAPFGGITITGAWAASATTIAAGTADYFSLQLLNGGTAGTATAAVSNALGGTPASGTAPGWVAATPQAFTITATADELTEGQYLMVTYDETGTVGIADWTVIVEYVAGKG
jgi:hypothetical protein